MLKKYYLAIDIGASSGRHILAYKSNNQIFLEEIYRFENNVIRKDGKIVWDIDLLIKNVIKGMKHCKNIGKIPVSVGIDTFGVDYVLLNGQDEQVGDVYAYRDTRTLKSRETFSKLISLEDQFQITGIQPQVFNTIYQLYDDVQNKRLDQVKSILLLPSYLGFYLTGVKQNEYTIASTTGLLNAQTQTWDPILLEHLGIKESMFSKLINPGHKIGNMTKHIQEQIGYDITLYSVASHDTASSVLGSLADEDTIFLSSGTWSLIGVLTNNRYINSEILSAGFTNEGSPLNKNRFLKNVMGLWIIQEVIREQNKPFDIDEVIEMARKSSDFKSVFSVNDKRFLSPKSMMGTICEVLRESQQPVPKTLGEYYYCIYHSLAVEYAKTVQQIETIFGHPFNYINIIGGGSKNSLLNELTRKLSKKNIICGPAESTALGNVIMQMISDGSIKDDEEAKSYVKSCFQN